MRVALVNIEPKVENTAYMQISQYHKQQGDTVEWYSPMYRYEYDKIYCSSIFDFTDKSQVPKEAICGGTGFKDLIAKRLPPEIESCDLDYSLYPRCRTSYIWFSRGCPKNHDFCVVPQKEGRLRCVQPKNLNPNATRVSVMDNSFTALPDAAFFGALNFLERLGLPVDFECGIDCRIDAPERWIAIRDRLKIYRQIRTAWDIPSEDLRDALKRFAAVFGTSKVMVYVFIGKDSTPAEDLMRVEEIRKLKLDAWVMPYNKKDRYQKAFERWNNRHCKCDWKDYDVNVKNSRRRVSA
jgi:hypothetical protein